MADHARRVFDTIHDCEALRRYNKENEDEGGYLPISILRANGRWYSWDTDMEGQGIDGMTYCPFCGEKLELKGDK